MKIPWHTTPVGRCYYLLRYHRAEQLFHRLLVRTKRWWQSRHGNAEKYERLPRVTLSANQSQSVWQALRHRLGNSGGPQIDLKRELAGEFTFLNQTMSLGNPIDWQARDPTIDHLWRFHLHYHEFLTHPFRRGQSPSAEVLEDAWQIVRDWIHRYPISTEDALINGWHPFCISRRLPVWVFLWQLGEPRDSEAILSSIYSQATYLSENLELDLGGNHLLENLRALVVVGAFLSAGNSFLNLAHRHLARELPRQILDHGEHYERCPMYHGHMLDCLIEICDAARDVAPDLAVTCEPYLEPMVNFLTTICHPDGSPAQFGDTSMDHCLSTTRLVERTRSCRTDSSLVHDSAATELPKVNVIAGYWSYRNDGNFFVMDASRACADELPGHAHADLLGYELSLNGRRVITDSGVFDYRTSPMRDYCRGTAAHNVLLIDGRDQFDIWSRFRMGYRGIPTGFASGEQEDFSWVRATHDAYRRLGVPETGRLVVAHASQVFFVFDWAIGTGNHLLESLVHFHPDVQAEKQSSNVTSLNCCDDLFSVTAIQGSNAQLDTSWACPRLGERVQRSMLRVGRTAKLPCLLGYWIAPRQRTVEVAVDKEDPARTVHIEVDGNSFDIDISSSAIAT